MAVIDATIYRSNFRGNYVTRGYMDTLKANPTGDLRVFPDGQIVPIPTEVARFKNGNVMPIRV